jgi:hypothetical protein
MGYCPRQDTHRTENDKSNKSYIFACAFITAVTFLTEPSKDKVILIMQLSSRVRGIHIYIYRNTDLCEGDPVPGGITGPPCSWGI